MLDALASTGSEGDNPRQAGRFDRPGDLQYPSWRIYRAVEVDQSCLGQVRLGPLEEGLAVPKSQADRIESGVLGEYALGFGKGYFIHGTLYPASLGRMSPHTCIRLNDDLNSVHRLAKVGTAIMIF